MRVGICPIRKKEFAKRKHCKNREPIYCSSKCYGKSIAKYKICKNCGEQFYNCQNKDFCSMRCAGEFKKGKNLSEEHKKALSLAKKGKAIPHLHNKEIREKIKQSLKGKPQPWNKNEKHHEWKAEQAGYTAMHQWLRRHFGKADRCENKDCIYPRKDKSRSKNLD